ncbi:MAG TPA: NUDIX domain-containing protein [Candidatus Saccharimonadales bacterium]
MKIGNSYIGVTMCFVVHDGQKNLLLQKRSKNCRDEQGRWDIGGGALEFGESWEAAVRREISEELDAKIIKLDFLKAFNALRNENNLPSHWVALVYAVQVEPKSVKINEPDKIDEIGWFRLNKLPKPLHSMIGHALETAEQSGYL